MKIVVEICQETVLDRVIKVLDFIKIEDLYLSKPQVMNERLKPLIMSEHSVRKYDLH